MTQATILVADQEADHLHQLERIFQAAGYIPIGAKSAKEALETISRFNPDVCFLNPELPHLEPFSLQSRIAERRSMPPIILVLTVRTNTSTRQKYLSQFGASGVVSAPFSSPEVILAIENLIGKRHQPLIKDTNDSDTFSDIEETFNDSPLANALNTAELVNEDSDSFNTLSDLLNEVSGQSKDFQDLSDRFKTPTKPLGESKKFTVEPDIASKARDAKTSSTVRVSSEDVQREMARFREKMAEKPQRKPRPKLEKLPDDLPSDKPRMRFSHGDSGHRQDASMGSLTSSDIFGALIHDIESGNVVQEPMPSGSAKAEADPKGSTIPAEDAPTGPIEQDRRNPHGPFATQPIPIDDTANFAEPEVEDPVLAEPDADDQTPTTGNQYQMLEKIASGGMAEVWKSKLVGEKGFEKIVAIKKILPHLGDNDEFITMFIDEAKVAANLTHPNIAQIYELGKMGDSFFIAMEYVGGYNLRQILNFCKGMNITVAPEVAVFIGMKLCNALHYAHLKKGYDNQPLNIVHRDVSPQNILISLDGEIKLVDFGIAKASNKASQTIAGSLKGKLLYMSPEQADGKSTDGRSDAFSLASVLYEALTGEKLFGGDSELSVLKNVRQAKYKTPREVNPEIPPALEDILLKTLSKSPDDRYESAKDLEKAFKYYLKQEKLHLTESDIADYLKWIVDKDVDKLRAFASLRHHGKPPSRATGKASHGAPQKAKAPASKGTKSNKKVVLVGLALLTLAALIWLVLSMFVFNPDKTGKLFPNRQLDHSTLHFTLLFNHRETTRSALPADIAQISGENACANGVLNLATLRIQTKALVAQKQWVKIGFLRLT